MNGMEIALREGRTALEEGEIPVGAALFLGAHTRSFSAFGKAGGSWVTGV